MNPSRERYCELNKPSITDPSNNAFMHLFINPSTHPSYINLHPLNHPSFRPSIQQSINPTTRPSFRPGVLPNSVLYTGDETGSAGYQPDLVVLATGEKVLADAHGSLSNQDGVQWRLLGTTNTTGGNISNDTRYLKNAVRRVTMNF